MKRSINHRVREWAADRFSSVQYPNIYPADHVTAEASASMRWKYAMPWYERMGLAVLSSAVIVISLIVLAALLFVVYIALT